MKIFISLFFASSLLVNYKAVCIAQDSNPSRDKKAGADIWISSDIEPSYYKGTPKREKPFAGRGPYAQPIQSKGQAYRTVHSLAVPSPSPNGTVSDSIVGGRSVFAVQIKEGYEPGGEFYWIVGGKKYYTERLEYPEFPISSSSQPWVIGSNSVVQLANTNQDSSTAQMKIIWHRDNELDSIIGVKFPNGNFVKNRYFQVDSTNLELKTDSLMGSKYSSVDSIPLAGTPDYKISVTTDGGPEYLEKALEVVEFFTGSGGDAASAYIANGVTAGWVSSAISGAGYVIGKLAPDDTVESLPENTDLEDLFVKAVNSDKGNAKPSSPPYGTEELPMFVEFGAPYDTAEWKQDIQSRPQDHASLFSLYKLGIVRKYERKQIKGREYDRHGYVDDYDVLYDKRKNDNVEFYGFFAVNKKER